MLDEQLEKAREPFRKRARGRLRKIRFNMLFQAMVVLLCIFILYFERDVITLAIVILNCLPFIPYIRDYKYYKGFLND